MAHEPAAGVNVAPALPTHKTCTKCGVTKTTGEFYKDARRGGWRSQCKSCHQSTARNWAMNNPDRAREAERRWKQENPDKARGYTQAYRDRDPERAKAIFSRWLRRYPEKNAARIAKYRVAREQACPPWVDHAEIAKVYAEAVRLTQETGIPHEVDHVIPLQHRLVCGLHVPWNLRAIPATENQRKSNKLLLQPHEVIE